VPRHVTAVAQAGHIINVDRTAHHELRQLLAYKEHMKGEVEADQCQSVLVLL
jgi:hypothetical protein